MLVRIRAVLPALRPSERRIADAAPRRPDRRRRTCRSPSWPALRHVDDVGRALLPAASATEHFRDLRLDLARESAREHVQHADVLAQTGDIDRDDSLADIVAKVASNETLSIADTAAVLDIDALRSSGAARAQGAVGSTASVSVRARSSDSTCSRS